MTESIGEGFTAILKFGFTEIFSRERNYHTLSRAVGFCAEEAEKACAGRPVACTAGCPHCCVLNVAALLPEAAVIARRLRDRLGDNAGTISTRLASHSSWVRWMDDDERIARKAFCPFLDDAGRCSIHPVRPLACRGVVSLDSAECRKAFSPIITDDERSVPTDLLRREIFGAAFAAFAETLGEQGIDNRSIELGTGVMAFLNEPGYLEELLSGSQLPRHLWG